MSTEEAVAGFEAALLVDDAEQLYDRAPCGYLSTSPDGLILKVNATFLALTGYEREALVGCRTFAELLSAGGRIYHETHYAPMLRMSGSVREIALDLVRADGSRVPVLINSVLDRAADGTPLVIRVAVFDATDRREYERELLRSKQLAEASEVRATALAEALQRTLLPPEAPRIPGLDLAAAYRPAGDGAEVGGDFYDVFPVGGEEWAVLLGDVSGKGVEAAIVTTLARYVVRDAAVRLASPAAALRALNTAVYEHETERFCTAVQMRLRPRGEHWSVVISCGGHALPLRRTVDGEVGPVGIAGSLLGLLPEVDVENVEVDLHPGEMLLLVTDGVPEGRRDREFFGEQRILDIFRDTVGDAAQVVNRLVDEVLAFQDQRPRDDIAVVALRLPEQPTA